MDQHPLATNLSLGRRAPKPVTGVGPARIVLSASEHQPPGARGICHLHVNFARRTLQQAIPFSLGSDLAKTNLGNFTRTGRACITVELGIRAAEADQLPDDDLRWLAEILAPVCLAFEIPAEGPTFLGVGSQQQPDRLDLQQWADFGGICGLQHVPGVTRWDPGRLNTERLFEFLRRLGVPRADGTVDPVPVPTPVEEVEFTPTEEAAEVVELIEPEPSALEALASTFGAVVEEPETFEPQLYGPLPGFRGKAMKEGSKAKSVRVWQEAIGAPQSGVHDSTTVELTKEIQSHFGLEPTGEINRETWTAMAELA